MPHKISERALILRMRNGREKAAVTIAGNLIIARTTFTQRSSELHHHHLCYYISRKTVLKKKKALSCASESIKTNQNSFETIYSGQTIQKQHSLAVIQLVMFGGRRRSQEHTTVKYRGGNLKI